jgi:hypothetical protein
MKALWLPLALAALLAPALASADYFRYETDEGVLAFTDDMKRVPSRYGERVETVTEQSLFDYARATIVPRGASNTAAPTPVDLELAIPATESAGPTGARMQISSNPSTTTIEVPADAKAPVRIERYTVWRWVDGLYAPHTVVKKDGQIVSIMRLR